jgi:CHAT domain-containing protein/tetratricopeptide (TPR) repeat protein
MKRLIGVCICLFSAGMLIAQSGYERADEFWQAAQLAEKEGDFQSAASYFEQSAHAEKATGNPRANELYFALREASFFYTQIGDLDKGLSLRNEAYLFCQNVFGSDNEYFGEDAYWMGWYYTEKKQFLTALKYAIESFQIADKLADTQPQEYQKRKENLAGLYLLLEHDTLAIPLLEEIVEHYETSGYSDHEKFEQFLEKLAISYDKAGLIGQSLAAYEKLLNRYRQQGSQETEKHQKALINMAGLFKSTGELGRSMGIYTQVIADIERLWGKSHAYYALALKNLASVYELKGQYQKAQSLFLEALEHMETDFGKENLDYAQCVQALGMCYLRSGQLEIAQTILLEAKERIGRIEGTESIAFAWLLNDFYGLYIILGDYQKAHLSLKEARRIFEIQVGNNHPANFTLVNNLSQFLLEMGQHEESFLLAREALKVCSTSYGEKSTHFALALNNLSAFYERNGHMETALELLSQSLELTEELYGNSHHSYAMALNNIAGIYQKMGAYQKALDYYLEVLRITEENLGKNHYDYGECLSNVASAYSDLQDYDKAIKIGNEALSYIEHAVGKEHRSYVIVLNNLADVYDRLGDYDKMLALYHQALQLNFSRIKSSFLFMSEKEKRNFIATLEDDFQRYASFFSRYQGRETENAGLFYDMELAIKGLVLQSTIEMRNVILSSGDGALLNKFEEWSHLRKQLAKENNLAIHERRNDITELEKRADAMEAELTELSVGYRENKAMASARWTDVQKVLRDGEVALEFASFQYHNGKYWTDSLLYVALLLRKDLPSPMVITLCEQRQLDSLLNKKGNSDIGFVSSLYRSMTAFDLEEVTYGQRLYELIWKPLENYLKEGEHIYFVPSGTLHQVAFAAIPVEKNKFLRDVYRLEQLSSTAALIEKKESFFTVSNLVLFGGIDFDKGDESILLNYYNTSTRSYSIQQKRSGKWSYLPGTKEEVEAIARLAKSKKVRVVRTFSGDLATEACFKEMAGKNSPEILHIATHGFFFPDPQQSLKSADVSSANSTNVEASENPLFRSGLIMAGGNQAWQGESIKDGAEDGILFAYEVSGLVFSNTKLIVLSACETGLGDVKGSEGVFGLQRAFRASGATYLVMSLWKVPDAESSEFMQNFYSELFGGKSVQDAFQNTQSVMRSKYPTEPFKWAAFVLLR